MKNVKKRAFMKKIKKTLTTLNKNVFDKLTKLINRSEKISSKITVLICMTTFEGYGSS